MPNRVGQRRGSRQSGPQLGLAYEARERRRQEHPTWGGVREGAGRRRAATRPSVPHAGRPRHASADPVHITLRARRDAAILRSERVFAQLRAGIRAGQRPDFRIVHFSVQRDHVHLLVEAHDRTSLTRGMQGLAIRLARAVNRATRLGPGPARRGKVWAERYHRRDLKSPREVRSALVYVLQNHYKHGLATAPSARRPGAVSLDPCSSAAWFDGWTARAGPLLGSLPKDDAEPPVARPRTWLAREGWRRHRLVDPAEAPA